MKSILRSSPVQFILSQLIWAYMALIGRTVRWTIEGAEHMDALWEQPEGFIIASWHSRIIMLPTIWTQHLRKRYGDAKTASILISLSRDGEFVARASEQLGLHIIRGSSANRKKAQKNKGAAAAIREVGELLDQGAAVCMTVDGPRGPRQRAGMGAVVLAQRKQAKIITYALACSPAKRFNSWDNFVVPLPFTKGTIIIGEPIDVDRSIEAEAIRLQLESELNAATKKAEEMCGGIYTDPAPLNKAPASPASSDLAAE